VASERWAFCGGLKELSRINKVFGDFAEDGEFKGIVLTTWKVEEDERNESSDSLTDRRRGPRIGSSVCMVQCKTYGMLQYTPAMVPSLSRPSSRCTYGDKGK